MNNLTLYPLSLILLMGCSQEEQPPPLPALDSPISASSSSPESAVAPAVTASEWKFENSSGDQITEAMEGHPFKVQLLFQISKTQSTTWDPAKTAINVQFVTRSKKHPAKAMIGSSFFAQPRRVASGKYVLEIATGGRLSPREWEVIANVPEQRGIAGQISETRFTVLPAQ